MSYEGTDVNGLATYCRRFSEALDGTALIIGNVQTSATSTIQNHSELDALFYVGGQRVAHNYIVATTIGGFTSSASAAETATAGTVPLAICVAGRAVTDWQVTYSLSVLK